MFRRFCKTHNLFAEHGAECTHLLMDGGRLYVPNVHLVQFYKEYIKCINSGEKIPLIEKLGKNCLMRFFLDVDKTDTVSDILDASNAILDKVPHVYHSSDGNGYHIVYNVQYTHQQCIDTCSKIQAALASSRRVHIDSSVYSTGLRMIYADKYVKGEYLDRWYIPLHHSKHDRLSSDMLRHSIVRIKSIDNLPNQTAVLCNSDLQGIEKFLSKLHKEYDNIKLRGTKMINNVLCIATDSKFCMNVNRDHSSNHIYFVVNQKLELRQKCHSKNLTSSGRIFCFCCEYKSTHVQLPKRFQTLF